MSPSVINLLRPGVSACVTGLVAVNMVVFLLSCCGPDLGASIRQHFSLWPNAHSRIFVELWRLFTFQFIHLGPLHLVSTLFVIVQGGPILERAFGAKKFLGFYLGSAAVAAFLYELLVVGMDPSLTDHHVRLSGASGGVYAILAGLVTLHPTIRVGLPRFSIPLVWIVATLIILNAIHIRGLNNGGEIIHLIALGLGWFAATHIRTEKRRP